VPAQPILEKFEANVLDIRYSIIIPTYNRSGILMDAIASAKDGAPPQSEIIVVNDGDALPVKVAEFLHEKSVIYLETQKATGAGAARNLGARTARGKWLFFLDDDDMIMPHYWTAVASYISKNLTDRDAAYGFCHYRSFKTRTTMREYCEEKKLDFSINRSNRVGFRSKLTGLGVGFWVSKTLFTGVGGISESLMVNEDTDFCLRLLAQGASCHSTNKIGVLIFSGSHDVTAAGSTTRSSNSLERMGYFQTIIKAHESLLHKDKKTAYWLFKRYTSMAARANQPNAIAVIWRANLLNYAQKSSLVSYFLCYYVMYLLKRNIGLV